MIEVYKILTNKYDSRVNLYVEKQQDNITRDHSLKLVNNSILYDYKAELTGVGNRSHINTDDNIVL